MFVPGPPALPYQVNNFKNKIIITKKFYPIAFSLHSKSDHKDQSIEAFALRWNPFTGETLILIINVTPWLHSGSTEQSPQTSLGYLETKSPTWPPLGNNLDGFFAPRHQLGVE